MTEYYDVTLAQMKESLSAEEFELKRAELESQKELFSSAWMNFLIMSTTVFIIGLIISIISAVILQRKN